MRRFVVIEGPIGVGKTSLCRRLADANNAELVLEPHDDNPFLEPFYKDPARYALPVQMSFLLSRFQQQDRIRQLNLFKPWIVSDYVFDKDRLFAEKTLNEHDLDIYDRVATALGARVATPDLVVYLDAPTKVLLQRIRQRGIKGEDRIEAPYLDDLRKRYDRLWAGWTSCPLLRIDNRSLNTESDPEALEHVLRRIHDALDGPPSAPGSFSDREATQPSLFHAAGRQGDTP